MLTGKNVWIEYHESSSQWLDTDMMYNIYYQNVLLICWINPLSILSMAILYIWPTMCRHIRFSNVWCWVFLKKIIHLNGDIYLFFTFQTITVWCFLNSGIWFRIELSINHILCSIFTPPRVICYSHIFV